MKEGLEKKLQNLRIEVQKRLDERKRNPELVIPEPLPRYDEIFHSGFSNPLFTTFIRKVRK